VSQRAFDLEHELRVLQVSELVAELREALWDGFGLLRVEGELASLHRSRAGHLYFDLKDESSQLRCVMFRREALAARFDLAEGMQVQVRARLDVYPERGALQLIVNEIQPCGEGALRLAFERLKARLLEEGVFDAAHKRALPWYPRRIGVVTSKQGAAIHDLVRGLRRRGASLELVLYDSRVQGADAWRELVRGLHLLAADPSIDVIILARGGGSLEDLWSFNREELVRAVYELDTPVVSAVGHEVDLVLTDLVADARAATPSAAAELVVPDASHLWHRLAELQRRLTQRQRGVLRELAQRLDGLRRGLVHPAQRLAELERRLAQARERLGRAVEQGRVRCTARLHALGGRLDALSPLAVLERGYSITRRQSDGAILKSSREVAVGDGIRVRLHEGALAATVTHRTSREDER
jgi:exodeoxyribonuclease VII large subunit